MASISAANLNEFLPGLEDFLRSMSKSSHLDSDDRQIASMYLDRLDQLSQLSLNQQSSNIDDPSLMNTDIISDEDSDDFTDEEEQIVTPILKRSTSICDNQLYNSIKQESNISNSQWYIDIQKNDYFQSLDKDDDDDISLSIKRKRSSISRISSSNIIADGLLLTYYKNDKWICHYYVLDNYDLICFSADKKSHLKKEEQQSDKNCSPLWVSDMTNAKVHITTIDQIQCLCLQIGLADAIYVRPSDPNQMNIWFKAFQDASLSKKSKENCKNQNNVKSLSRNARRIFTQFNRKKSQIVSHLLDQMATITGVDDKTRKHCELRGFLIISFDNSIFVTKYCTIVDGLFRIHKSRLSEQTEYKFDLNKCTLSFPDQRTRYIQFQLINQDNNYLFIRGNNIYTMGRLLNTLAKYVQIKQNSQNIFQLNENNLSIKLNQSQTSHFYSDVHLLSRKKSLRKTISTNICQLDDNQTKQLDRNPTPIQQHIQDIYHQTKSHHKYNNQIIISPRTTNNSNLAISRSSNSSSNISSINNSIVDIDSPSSQCYDDHPRPLPRRSSIDYTNKFGNILTKNSYERDISTQTYDKIQSLNSNSKQIQSLISKDVYDIPITIQRPTKYLIPSIEKSSNIINENEQTTYDNLSKIDGIGKFRFIIPFNHSSKSAFTTIKPINSPRDSSSSTISSNSTLPQTSSSSNYSNSNTNNNNNNNRTRLMTAV